MLAKVNVNWHKQPGKAAKLIKFVKLKKTAVIYADTGIIIAAAGIIISFVSFIQSISIIKNLLNEKSLMGNELYLIASIMTLFICICILTWGFKRVISSLITIIRDSGTRPEKFDDYKEVEDELVQEKVPSSDAKSGTIFEKDEAFIWKYLFLLGFIILSLIGKTFFPDEFFWNLGLTRDYFSFPLGFMVIFSTAVALRLASMHFHRHQKSGGEVYEKIVSIKGAGHPSTFAPGIEKALLSLRKNGNPNIVIQTGFNETEESVRNTGKTEGKMFIETPPRPVPCEPHPIGYFYLLFSILLNIVGFLLVTRLPPDNISVLTVPTIAIGHLWAMVKGGILVFCGKAFQESVSSIFRTDLFESVMVYVNIRGISGRTIVRSGKGLNDSVETMNSFVRSDCYFWVYTAKLLTEVDNKKGKRHIIKRTVDKDSEKAKELVAGAIEKFKKGREQKTEPENTKKILILSANPRDTDWLSLEKEVREIEEGLKRSEFRGNFEIQTRWAVRPRDLRRSLLESKPQIVHFSGHGEKQGLIVEDDELGIAVPFPKKALSGLFRLCSHHVECVILNACNSERQAAAISQHINYVIGMRKEIKDNAAIEFSVGFYDALGAGKSVEEAFEFGCNAIQQKHADIPDDLMPVLKIGAYNKTRKFLYTVGVPRRNKFKI